MILLKRLGGFVFDTGWGGVSALLAGLALLFTAYTVDQRAIGARDAKATVERASGAAAAAGSSAAGKSERVRDVRFRDPTTRD